MVEPSSPHDLTSTRNEVESQTSDNIKQHDRKEPVKISRANDGEIDVEDTTATTSTTVADNENTRKRGNTRPQKPKPSKAADITKQQPQQDKMAKDNDDGTTQLLALAAIAAAAQPQQEQSDLIVEETPATKHQEEKPTIPRAPSSLSNSSSETSHSKQKSFRRRGKWTPEEETYVARVIQEFNSGYLPAVPGTTLRSYLSDKLQCDPMRITKKFTGEVSLPLVTFITYLKILQACIGKRVFHPAIRTLANAETFDTAVRELKVLEDNWRRRLELQQRESAKKAATTIPNEHTNPTIANVTQTASWLDRAKLALTTTTTDIDSVERLIHEGTDHKRLRRASDQEAFVGFLKSVHAKHQE